MSASGNSETYKENIIEHFEQTVTRGANIEYFQPTPRVIEREEEGIYPPVIEYYEPGQQCRKETLTCSLNIPNPHRLPMEYAEPDYGPGFISANQQLAGPPSRRTMVPPVLVPPCWSSEWKENNLVVFPHINTETNEDLSRSGYIVTNPTKKECGDYCGETACCGEDVAELLNRSTFAPAPFLRERTLKKPYLRENFEGTFEDSLEEAKEAKIGKTIPARPQEVISSEVREAAQIGRVEAPEGLPAWTGVGIESPYTVPNNELRKYKFPVRSTGECPRQRSDITELEYLPGDFPGGVLMSDGYFPQQVPENNLPSNRAYGACPKAEEFKEYNKQLHTVPIQPNVNTRNQIIEPISSNIGISFTQQFEPITCDKDCDGITFIGHDPNLQPNPEPSTEQRVPYDRQTHLSDIYDPRLTGYGTSYRSYVEPVTGQPRFYYDDVDAYKRPNYITKSNVDFLPSSLATQAIPNDEFFEVQNKNARAIANEAFMDNTINFRTDLQERLMRKANADIAQSRRFPKHTRSFNRGNMRNARSRR